jgi:ammonia channel protein AmtB
MLGIVFSEIVLFIILKRVDAAVGLRVETDHEVRGFDVQSKAGCTF